MGRGRGWLAGNWSSTGGVLNITAAAWTAGFQWWRSGDITRTQNVSEYMLVLALYLGPLVTLNICFMISNAKIIERKFKVTRGKTAKLVGGSVQPRVRAFWCLSCFVSLQVCRHFYVL